MSLSLVAFACDDALLVTLGKYCERYGMDVPTRVDDYLSEGSDLSFDADSDAVPVAFVGLDRDRDRGFLTARLLAAHEGAKIEVVVATADTDSAMLRAAARQFTLLPLPADDADVKGVLDRFRPSERFVSRRQDETQQRRGKLTLFAGASGGVGCTTLAVQTALSFAGQGRKVLLIDAVPSLGHVALYLHHSHKHRFDEVLRSSFRLDGNLLCESVERHSDTLDLLLSGDTVNAHECDPDGSIFRQVLPLLRRSYDHIIVDARPSSGIIPSSDYLFLVLQPTTTSVFSALQHLTVLRSDAQLAINRYREGLIGADHIARRLPARTAACFSEDPEVASALYQGGAVSAGARGFHGQLQRLLGHIDPGEVVEPGKSPTAWLPWKRFKRQYA